jgi:transposase-like protein
MHTRPTLPTTALSRAATPAAPVAPVAAAGFPFDRFRRLRYGHGRPRCPHCDHTHVHRWGSFRGRRRYRCVACSRTFSDFTGTPLAHLKHIHRWPAFCATMPQGLSVRATARRLGVDKDTAFRWRHRLLAALAAADTGPLGTGLRAPCGPGLAAGLAAGFAAGFAAGPGLGLSATVAFGETWFPLSEKGSRCLDRPPRRRAAFRREAQTPVWVFVARDGRGGTATGVVGLQRPRAPDLEAALGARLGPAAELVCPAGPYGAVGMLAARLDLPYRRAPGSEPELAPVRAYILDLRRWVRRFRGVATRYLDHYLAWHRLLAT